MLAALLTNLPDGARDDKFKKPKKQVILPLELRQQMKEEDELLVLLMDMADGI